MSHSDPDKLQGRTLKVYLYTVKEKKPVGPRDVMRGIGLSSPSVAYRHLQKLETMGLLIKNENGNYVEKEKTSIKGYLWVGRRLIPNPLVYSSIFLSILTIEFGVLAIHFSVETNQFKIFFLLLTLITIAALVLFLFEGFRMLNKTRISPSEKN